ncbi:MAG: tetratricopeptide repeat protein [Alphaproteobacteria bacterium]|nr:tetratricopeptide repeat protein [Alphaproteobacteria bacterium]
MSAHMKYNPGFLDDAQLVERFVVREHELASILETIRENTGGNNQHVLVIGRRGYGKTMLVHRVAAELRRDPELSKGWFPVVFGEESYQVLTAGELWLEALLHMGDETGDASWHDTYTALRAEQDEQRLTAGALARLLDFADDARKRLVLVIENLQMLVDEQLNDRDAWAVRKVLLGEPRIMFLCTALSRFEGEQSPDAAMYELFRRIELEPLTREGCAKLWASVSGEDLDEERIAPMKILTGGNPRLVMLLASFAQGLSLRQLMQDLTKLIDDRSDYFKHNIEALKSNERKVFVTLADIWSPAPSSLVAERARMDVNNTSATLGHLVRRGVVEVARTEGRRKYYQITERLYNIYHLMRRRGGASARVHAVVDFMVALYGGDELEHRLRPVLHEAMGLDAAERENHLYLYMGVLEHFREDREEFCKQLSWLPPVMAKEEDLPVQLRAHIDNPETFVTMLEQASDEDAAVWAEEAVGRLSQFVPHEGLCDRVVERVVAVRPEWGVEIYEEYITVLMAANRRRAAEVVARRGLQLYPDAEGMPLLLFCTLYTNPSSFAEVVSLYDSFVEEDKQAVATLMVTALALAKQQDRAEYLLTQRSEHKPAEAADLALLGDAMTALGRYSEAEALYRRALEIADHDWTFQLMLAYFLVQYTKEVTEGEALLRETLKQAPTNWFALYGLATALKRQERIDEAESAWRQLLELNSEHGLIWFELGRLLLFSRSAPHEAMDAFKEALRLDPDDVKVLWLHSVALSRTPGTKNEQMDTWRRILTLAPDHVGALSSLSEVLIQQGDFHTVEQLCLESLRANPDRPFPCFYLAEIYHHRGEADRAAATLKAATAHEPERPAEWMMLLRASVLFGGEDPGKIVDRCIDVYGRNIHLLFALANIWFQANDNHHHPLPASLAREAFEQEPEVLHYLILHLLLLVAGGTVDEALPLVKRALHQDPAAIREELPHYQSILIDLVALDGPRRALDLVVGSPAEPLLEPLVVAMRQLADEVVDAPVEVNEIAEDVKARIAKRQEVLTEE